MSGEEKAAPVLDFRGCRLDVETGDLTGPDGRKTRLAPQPTRLLALLAGANGRLVTRERIAETLWPHGSVEVDQGIGYAMREVRKALEAVGCDPATIETIPRRGFRLRSTAAEAHAPGRAGGEAAASVEREGSAVVPTGHAGGDPTPPPIRSALAVAVLALLAAVAILASAASLRPPPSMPIVILFQHRTDDGRGDTAARALATTLTTRLTRDYAGAVGVVGPTGTSTLDGPDDTARAREELGACLVVSGSLRVVPGGEAVVFTQIVRTADRVHVWASTDTLVRLEAYQGLVPPILAAIADAATGCEE